MLLSRSLRGLCRYVVTGVSPHEQLSNMQICVKVRVWLLVILRTPLSCICRASITSVLVHSRIISLFNWLTQNNGARQVSMSGQRTDIPPDYVDDGHDEGALDLVSACTSLQRTLTSASPFPSSSSPSEVLAFTHNQPDADDQEQSCYADFVELVKRMWAQVNACTLDRKCFICGVTDTWWC